MCRQVKKKYIGEKLVSVVMVKVNCIPSWPDLLLSAGKITGNGDEENYFST